VVFVKRLVATVSDTQVENPLEALRRLCEKMGGEFRRQAKDPSWYVCSPPSLDYMDLWRVTVSKRGGRARLEIDSFRAGRVSVEADNVVVRVFTVGKDGTMRAGVDGEIEVNTGFFHPLFGVRLTGGTLTLEI